MLVSARKLVDIALVACLAYPSAQCAFGQVVRPAPVPGQAVPQAGQVNPGRPVGPNQGFDRGADQGQILQGSTIIGAQVMLQGGAGWGTLRDFVISPSGCIESAVIAADNGLYVTPWSSGMYDFGRRAFVLDISRDRIRDLPRIRDIAELRDPKFRQQHDAFFRGDNNTRDQRGLDNRPDMRRGGENHPQQGTTTRGATPTRGATGNQQPVNRGNETRGQEIRGAERRER
jgi:hypothetical protein